MKLKVTTSKEIRENINAYDRAVDSDEWVLAMKFAQDAQRYTGALYEHAKRQVLIKAGAK